MCSLYRDDKMLATAGLQISHPTASGATPTVVIISGKAFRCLILREEVILEKGEILESV